MKIVIKVLAALIMVIITFVFMLGAEFLVCAMVYPVASAWIVHVTDIICLLLMIPIMVIVLKHI